MGNASCAKRSSSRHHPVRSPSNYPHPSSRRYLQQDSFTSRISLDSKNRNNQQSAFIADNFNSLEYVINALRDAGLESSNLILGIDFTKSNDWTGKHSFHRRCLHATDSSGTANPYEQAISIIGQTLSPFDDDNLVPCFGFGDATTCDQFVFSFYPDHRPCQGFEEALSRYRDIVPHLKLSGPTSFAPIILAAIDIVERSNWQYHVLVIIADGQVTRDPYLPSGSLSRQEQTTIDAIVKASNYPLSIIMVGVGDGPWDAMHQFDDYVPQRALDNFQFVNFTKIMNEANTTRKEAAFALSALMEIPFQYRATQGLRPQKMNEDTLDKQKPLPPPSEVIAHDNAERLQGYGGCLRRINSKNSVPVDKPCPICLANAKDLAFSCGHAGCWNCGTTASTCPICRAPITTRLRLYS